MNKDAFQPLCPNSSESMQGSSYPCNQLVADCSYRCWYLPHLGSKFHHSASIIQDFI